MESRFCVGETVTNTIERFPDDFGCSVAYDKSGNTFDTPDTNTYLYNACSELTSATAAVDSDYSYGYNFDDIGNRKTSSERGTNSVYTASQLNQYTAVDDFTPTYDADGNETLVKTATGIWQVSYNGENRPVRWQQGPTVITMSFDRMGRRVTKNDQRFVYNGYLQIANFRSTTTTSDYNYFIWDPTESVATRPLVWQRSALGTQHSTLFYTHDGNKNVSEVVASNNDVAAHYEYAPFGALTVSRGTSAATNPWRFSSEYAEDDTATVYYNYRHYEPATGRWMRRDPICDDVVDCRVYAFCENSVAFRVDSLGLKISFDESSNPQDYSGPKKERGFTRLNPISVKLECSFWGYLSVNGVATRKIFLRPKDDSAWNLRFKRYNVWKPLRTNDEERECTLRHEMDHYQSYNDLFKYLHELDLMDGVYLGFFVARRNAMIYITSIRVYTVRQ